MKKDDEAKRLPIDLPHEFEEEEEEQKDWRGMVHDTSAVLCTAVLVCTGGNLIAHGDSPLETVIGIFLVLIAFFNLDDGWE